MRESWGGKAGRTTNSRIGWMLNDMCGRMRVQELRSLDYSVFDPTKFRLNCSASGPALLKLEKTNPFRAEVPDKRGPVRPAGTILPNEAGIR